MGEVGEVGESGQDPEFDTSVQHEDAADHIARVSDTMIMYTLAGSFKLLPEVEQHAFADATAMVKRIAAYHWDRVATLRAAGR